MQLYTGRHKYYCGIDLHTRFMYICIINSDGQILYHKNHRANAANLIRALRQFREDIVVCAECMYTWYWLADLCADENIPFVLGHAAGMRMIHGAKTKSDKLDSEKIARLLAAHMIPESYAYPSGMRETRSLLRRRMGLVSTRADFLAHLTCIRQQYNLEPLGRNLSIKNNRDVILNAFPEGDIARLAKVDVEVVDQLEPIITELEYYIENRAMVTDPVQLKLLRSVPGIGKILGLVMMYEIHDIARFKSEKQFSSYSRLIGCQAESGGKKLGVKGRKVGNVYLKWAFNEAAMIFLRGNKAAEKYKRRLENKHGKTRMYSIVAHRLGVTIYHMLKNRQAFDIYRFLGQQPPKGNPEVAMGKGKRRLARADKECVMNAPA